MVLEFTAEGLCEASNRANYISQRLPPRRAAFFEGARRIERVRITAIDKDGSVRATECHNIKQQQWCSSVGNDRGKKKVPDSPADIFWELDCNKDDSIHTTLVLGAVEIE
ncbi:hypothetical protein JZ751_005817 [Albula glossodonta]|uniref:Uncharacterized protein n=1 Tax=Albula glossodonta TaxID=121402 RepID=A0A8T2P500_9TELE|nr:hypothetical protein JZ751_005817 [Albula glossodonta]